jgi:uncharacterized protein YjbI with pentapeptide repeats
MANEEHLELIRQGVGVWNAWRRDTFKGQPDLSFANLSSELSESDVVAADYRDAVPLYWEGGETGYLQSEPFDPPADLADLLYSRPLQTDLSYADLSGANLSGANLSSVDLTRANLDDANLSRASLSSTNLTGAKLSRADFDLAIIGFTTFGNNDLSSVKGLNNVTHFGPSTIGVDTLYKSHGMIPEVFLRGAGLPESFITYFASLIAQPIEFYSCFISYSHADKSFAHRLHDALQGRGIRCWLDEHQLLPGEKIYTEVDRGIRLWDKVLLCCSKDALTSWWVDNEIKIAFDKEQHLWRERKKEVLALIPLNLDDYLFSGQWQSGLATEVKARVAANFSGWEQAHQKFEEQFERLVKALRTDSGGKEPSPPTLL